ncbi:MAG: hypothetical protein NT031_17075 [Planctomycetota bacterium]|nr:hypothetical protein [Planctomycetota bacterium]
MRTYDLYGFANSTMADVKVAVERIANTDLVMHDSSYRGGEYYRAKNGQEEIIVQQNRLEDEEWAEEDFKEYPLILYIAKTDRGDELRSRLLEKLPAARFLRRDTL